MEKDYWLNKWQSNDIAFHKNTVNPDLIQYGHLLNLTAGNTVFVPLCGKTADMLWFANQGIHVIGVELSAIACQDFFAEQNKKPHITKNTHFSIYQHDNIKLFCGDLFHLTQENLPTIKAIYDSKALIFLEVTIDILCYNLLLSIEEIIIRYDSRSYKANYSRATTNSSARNLGFA